MSSGDMQTLLKQHTNAEQLSFLMSYIYALHWLQHNVHLDYRTEVLAAFGRGPQAFLMQLLLQSSTTEDFVQAYIQYWLNYSGEPQRQQQQLFQLLAEHQQDPDSLCDEIANIWQSLGLFTQTYSIAYRDLAQEERDRYRNMLGTIDRERLQLVDSIADTEPLKPFAKLGVIPYMSCPQTCRHCMFIWRPLMKDTREPSELYDMVDSLTENLLFTGGDLSNHLDFFYQAISHMRHVRTFAILLNGDFADSRDIANNTLAAMVQAIRRRPPHWPKAKIILQISFDEFHQEVVVDKKGQLKERIPVCKIANIVETAPRYADDIQLCLLHKQHTLNFSMDLFRKGVFARLASELGRRGHQIQILSSTPSPRLKQNPQTPDEKGQLIKDASFILSRYPNSPIMLTSSTIDAYGRASMMDERETVKEKELLQQVLSSGPPEGEYFDTDLMFWFNGWVTLFSAVHMCLGDVYEEGLETIRKRHAKDPLSKALYQFDTRLLDYYREVKNDLDEIIASSTGPHHLFHVITEDAAMRLYMTKRLMGIKAVKSPL